MLPLERLPTPPRHYDAADQAQFRRSVETALMRAMDGTTTENYYRFTVGQMTVQQTIPFAATFTWAPAQMGSNIKITQQAAQTVALDASGLAVGSRITLELIQDGTGGRVTTWGTFPATISWGDAGAPVLNTGAGKRNVIEFLWDGIAFDGWKLGTGF